MENKKRIIGFVGATISLFSVYVTAALPIPLYVFYQKSIGITNNYLSIASVVYFLGTVLALLIFARISDYLGRRLVILFIIFLSIIGCIIFIKLQNISMLIVGRFIQGFSCGMASSTATAYIIDTSSKKISNIATIITGNIPMLGLAFGAIGSGMLKKYEIGSTATAFQIVIIFLLICSIFIMKGEETIYKSKGVFYSLVPKMKVPENIKPFLPTASAVFIGTWSIGGFYQAFSASMASEQFKTTDTIVAALIFTCLQFPSLFGGIIVGKLKEKNIQKIGMSWFFLSVVVVVFSLKSGNVVLFFIATISAGISWAISFTGSIKSILNKTEQQERTEVFSVIYLISYGGAAIPNLVVSYLADSFNLFQISIGYAVLVGVTYLFILYSSFKKQIA